MSEQSVHSASSQCGHLRHHGLKVLYCRQLILVDENSDIQKLVGLYACVYACL